MGYDQKAREISDELYGITSAIEAGDLQPAIRSVPLLLISRVSARADPLDGAKRTPHSSLLHLIQAHCHTTSTALSSSRRPLRPPLESTPNRT